MGLSWSHLTTSSRPKNINHFKSVSSLKLSTFISERRYSYLVLYAQRFRGEDWNQNKWMANNNDKCRNNNNIEQGKWMNSRFQAINTNNLLWFRRKTHARHKQSLSLPLFLPLSLSRSLTLTQIQPLWVEVLTNVKEIEYRRSWACFSLNPFWNPQNSIRVCVVCLYSSTFLLQCCFWSVSTFLGLFFGFALAVDQMYLCCSVVLAARRHTNRVELMENCLFSCCQRWCCS